MHYAIYFLGDNEQRVGRPTVLHLETDAQAQQQSQALAQLFFGVETWNGARFICRLLRREHYMNPAAAKKDEP